MTVIDISLWKNLQHLKQTHISVKQSLSSLLRHFQAQMHQTISILISKFQQQIAIRDAEIESLKEQNLQFQIEKPDNFNVQMMINRNGTAWEDQDIRMKYQQLLNQNKQYESQFANLMEEMKLIKIYVEELKRVRSIKDLNLPDYDSPVKDLNFEEQGKILNKISSLNRLQKIKINPYLDTIREVTQLSAHTEQDQPSTANEPEHVLTNFELNQAPAPFIQSHLSQSFECTPEIQDITNIFFDNNSQQVKASRNSSNSTHCAQFYQTFQHSLSVLKNYCGNGLEQTSKSINGMGFTIPLLEQLRCPNLRLKDVVNQRHLVFTDGFVYTGATVNVGDELKPMGFGQLYFKNSLFYCGEWKNGVFEGWGKMYLSKSSRLKYFNGKWSQGVANGPCSIKFWNNDKFTGTVSNQQIRGEGIYSQQKKAVYSGYWQNNRLVRCEI